MAWFDDIPLCFWQESYSYRDKAASQILEFGVVTALWLIYGTIT